MKKNNHYVPKTYLKQWAKNNKIQEYSLLVPHEKVPKWKEVSISRTSSLDYLYVFFQDGKLTDKMEDFFSEEFEMNFSTFMNKIDLHLPLNDDDKEYISKLVASQYLRTLNGFQNINRKIKEILPNVMQEVVDDLNNKIKNKNNLIIEKELEVKNELPVKVKLSKSDDNQGILEIESYIGKSYWIFALKYLLESTYKVLNTVSWCIYEAPKNFSWATSDDPVILLNYYRDGEYDFGGGWARKNTNIIFPLSPNKLLFAQIGENSMQPYATATYAEARVFQKYIVEHAHTKIYSDFKNSSISKIRKRVVNEKDFKQFWASIQNYHDDYVNNEIPYLKDTIIKNT